MEFIQVKLTIFKANGERVKVPIEMITYTIDHPTKIITVKLLKHEGLEDGDRIETYIAGMDFDVEGYGLFIEYA